MRRGKQAGQCTAGAGTIGETWASAIRWWYPAACPCTWCGALGAGYQTGATGIAVGGDHYACVTVTGGSVWCWGWNGNGSLGNGTTTNSDVPVQVSGVGSAISIATGTLHTAFLLAPTVALSPSSGASGTIVTATLALFGNGETANLYFGPTLVATSTALTNGGGTVRLPCPAWPEAHTW